MSDLQNYYEEKRSSYLYKSIAAIETNPVHKKLFLELSLLAEKQASIWDRQLKKQNITPKSFSPDLRARMVIFLVKMFGVRSLRLILGAMKIRGMSIYGSSLIHASMSHTPELENRHRSISKGNNVRAAVFGINDGLISNASLILGIAGAQVDQSMILLTGIAGLLAGACSMGAGEYVSVRSQREMLEYQLELEKHELELYPEEETQELSLIYQARGIPREEADKISALLIQNPEKALDTLAREELGINPDDLVSPTGAALSSFISFSVGAFIPIIPFVLSHSSYNLIIAIILTAISLFAVGALMSLFTQRNALWSGFRMFLIGGAAGALTYFIGSLFGISQL